MRFVPVLVAVSLFGCKGGGNIDIGEDTDEGTVSGAIAVTPDSIELGILFVGQSASADITIENVGNDDVDVRLEILGGKAASYTLSAYTSSAAPEETSTHTLSLTPTDWGDHAVSVLIDDEVSGGHVEVSVTAIVQIDADGDGFGSTQSGGADCDDANPAVNPGIAEVWYDAVDSDCAGDDDFDQDHDGVTVATDCDDTDATAYPGAADAWYDGKDSDCAGNSDYDQDLDGHDTPANGGGDCDDLNEAINPDADEVWYDGIDTDCDGGSDYDQDGDGSNLGVDCDDTNRLAYPGADEIWYDDVDEACDGGDDWDQDGDGTPYPTDCNDTDATTTGPSTEVLDGVDNDCDGVSDDFGIGDVASGVLYGPAASNQIGYEFTIAMGGDSTGSGGDDLLVGRLYSGSASAAVWVVAGTTALTAAGVVDSYDTAVATSTTYLGRVNGPMGDLDGDGDADWVSTSTTDPNQGYAYVWDGAASGTYTTTSPAAYVTNGTTDQIATSVVSDIDGDGVDDLVVGASGYNDGDTGRNEGAVAFYAGSTSFTGAYDLETDSDDFIIGDAAEDELGRTLGAGDVDGDGYGDVMAGAPSADTGGVVYVFLGNATLDFDDAASDEASLAIVASSYLGLGTDGSPFPGDFDGDGALDLAVAEDEVAGDVWIYMSAGALTGEIETDDADYWISGTTDAFGSSYAWSDVDDDGDDDLFVGADSDDTGGTDAGAVYVFSWTPGLASSLTPANANGRFLGAAAYDYLGASMAGGADLDGDGHEDIAVGAPGHNTGATSNTGAVYLIPGW